MDDKNKVDGRYLAIVILVVVIMVLLGIIWDYKIFCGGFKWLTFDNVFWAIAITVVCSVSLLFFEKKLFKKDESIDSSELVEVIKQVVDDNNQNIVNCLNLYSPLKSYPASDAPIDDFNNIIDREFAKSHTYRYMGDRSEYLPLRLDELKDVILHRGRGLDIEIMLPHIENDYFVSARLDSLKKKAAYIDIENVDELREKLIKDYKMSIVKALCAFCHLSSYYQFKIYFYDELPFIRYEILDEVMVLSLLTMDSHRKYPPTFIYSKESAFYNAFFQYHLNMIQLNKDKGLPNFDNASLNLKEIKDYALKCGLTEEDLEGVIQ